MVGDFLKISVEILRVQGRTPGVHPNPWYYRWSWFLPALLHGSLPPQDSSSYIRLVPRVRNNTPLMKEGGTPVTR
jgi:hypothetical protein